MTGGNKSFGSQTPSKVKYKKVDADWHQDFLHLDELDMST